MMVAPAVAPDRRPVVPKVPITAADTLAALDTAWASNQMLQSAPVLVKRAIQQLAELQKVVDPELLAANLPTAKIRPILAAAVVNELWEFVNRGGILTGGNMSEASPILRIIRTPYSPTVMADTLKKFQDAEDADPHTYLPFDDRFRDFLLSGESPTLNGSLKNYLLASRMNTFFFGTNVEVTMSLASYTLDEMHKQCRGYRTPTLPGQTAEMKSYRVCLVLRDGSRMLPCDFGHNEGDEKFFHYPTGEGIARTVGELALLSHNEVGLGASKDDKLHLLKEIAESQAVPAPANFTGSGDRFELYRTALEVINRHEDVVQKVLRFGETDAGRTFPTFITRAEDLTREQLDMVLDLARDLYEMRRYPGNQGPGAVTAGPSDLTFTLFSGTHLVVSSGKQASTRTVTSSQLAGNRMGFDTFVLTNSSADGKGETNKSQYATLSAMLMDVLLLRSGKFEQDAYDLKELAKHLGEKAPLMISLGGGRFHPTQFIATLEYLYDHYQLKERTLEALQAHFRAKPARLVVVGNVKDKRADQELIQYFLDHFPECQVDVLVPDDKYVPDFIVQPTGAKYTCTVSKEMKNPAVLAELVQGADILHVSNPYKTAEASAASGPQDTDSGFTVDHSVLDALAPDACVLHPLPAGDEFTEEALTHAKSAGIAEVIVYKETVIMALMCLGLQARRLQAQAQETPNMAAA